MERSNHAMFEGPFGDFNTRDVFDTYSDDDSDDDYDSDDSDVLVAGPICVRPPYVNDYPALPANGDLGFPHIVKASANTDIHLNTNEKLDIRHCDGIVTFLYNHKPDALAALLDNNNASFVLHAGLKLVLESKGKEDLDLIIPRAGKQITVGTFRCPPSITSTAPAPTIWYSLANLEVQISGKWALASVLSHDEPDHYDVSTPWKYSDHEMPYRLCFYHAHENGHAGTADTRRGEDMWLSTRKEDADECAKFVKEAEMPEGWGIVKFYVASEE